MTTPVWITGWESGILSTSGGGLVNTITGSPTIDSTTKRTGSYALRTYLAAASTQLVGKSHSGSPTVIVGVVYFRYHTLPDINQRIIRGLVNANSSCNLYFDPADQKIQGYVVALGNKCATVLAADTWYRIDFKFDVSANPSLVDFQVNGVAATQTTGAQAATFFVSTAYGINLSGTGDLYFDDIVISVTGGDYPIGACEVVALLPTSDGVHNNAANVLEDASGNDIDGVNYFAYAQLDELPMSEDVTRVQSAGAGAANYVEVNFADTSSVTIHGVQAVLAYMSASTSANSGATVVKRVDDTEISVYGTPAAPADMSETSMFYKSAIITAPGGGWTQAEVNALRGRVGYSADADPDPYWENLLLEIAYVALVVNYQTISGGFTPDGALLKETDKLLTGGITPAGIILKEIGKILSGIFTPSGSLVKMFPMVLTGVLSPTGSLINSTQKVLSGAVTSAGGLIKETLKILTGVVSFSGILINQINKLLSGGITPSGILSAIKVGGGTIYYAVLDGTLSLAGNVVILTNKYLTGIVNPTGTLTKQVSIFLDGVVGSSGSLIKLVGKIIGGILIPSGNLANSTNAININAPLEEMDCPDSWDDQLIQYYTNLGINTLIPPSIPGKAKTWL